jgi:hypothetical protein
MSQLCEERWTRALKLLPAESVLRKNPGRDGPGRDQPTGVPSSSQQRSAVRYGASNSRRERAKTASISKSGDAGLMVPATRSSRLFVTNEV